jgi:hypothetical protein
VRPAGIGAVLVMLLAGGCAGPRQASVGPAPVEIELVRGASFRADRPGHDPALPGFHLFGPIATVRLRLSESARSAPPSSLVLSIRTSTGAAAHLEGFRLEAAGTTLDLAPMPREALDQARPPAFRDSLLRAAGAGFFRFEAGAKEVRVHFEPVVLRCLAEGATISWVDWYRR